MLSNFVWSLTTQGEGRYWVRICFLERRKQFSFLGSVWPSAIWQDKPTCICFSLSLRWHTYSTNDHCPKTGIAIYPTFNLGNGKVRLLVWIITLPRWNKLIKWPPDCTSNSITFVIIIHNNSPIHFSKSRDNHMPCTPISIVSSTRP